MRQDRPGSEDAVGQLDGLKHTYIATATGDSCNAQAYGSGMVASC